MDKLTDKERQLIGELISSGSKLLCQIVSYSTIGRDRASVDEVFNSANEFGTAICNFVDSDI